MPNPQPQPAWGLYDASGKLRMVDGPEPYSAMKRVWEMQLGEGVIPGWTIRPGTFIPDPEESDV